MNEEAERSKRQVVAKAVLMLVALRGVLPALNDAVVPVVVAKVKDELAEGMADFPREFFGRVPVMI